MKNLLEPAYQPIFDLHYHRFAHYEALARIRHDDTEDGHGPLIRLAEKHKFIDQVDLAMFELVLETAATHDQIVAVNLSPYTVDHAFNELVGLLEEHHPLANRLILEITETLPVHDIKRLRYFLTVAHDYGARVAFDDYGNGKGCFTETLVRELRPDFLKLDGALLQRALFFDDTRELQQACDMAHDFGGQVIAEFVDSEQKIAYLRAVGVRFAQGAAYGMPCRRPAALAGMRGVQSPPRSAAVPAPQ